ncbi:nitrile hydratase subunit beta [Pandoraea cepalis]|uniref:nitrile hydratase n=1 Tax=Pandoraea cepalis TaxID=2508294 RepID=A0A5E4VLL7_9BURK|nr:nitrile hydratase subunit beta [Pandoraea cepalis]VVE13162.1 low-molecular weight cobalt-containing nitrile hydratase subunit beta [Pandoraea cepalis]
MDGFHDLGGRQGFGRVTKEGKADPFHEAWEIKVSSITGALVGRHLYNMDEFRHGIERMDPRHYIGASYFERTFASVATLCIEKGIFTYEELCAAVGEEVRLSRPSKGGRIAADPLPQLDIGDVVRVKADFVPGHIRLPAYIRGKKGTIVGVSPEYPFADAAAHGLESPKQRSYDVCFKTSDIWPKDSGSHEVHVGVFHSYLEKVVE